MNQYTTLQEYCKEHNTTLVAVSKTKPIEAIQALYDQGQRVFGENRMEELLLKKEALPKDIQWHFIGNLQTNKVKKLLPAPALIHSVDSSDLMKEIQKRSKSLKKVTDILLQVKIAVEDTKHGLDEDELDSILEAIDQGLCPNIRCRGLMGMATFTDDEMIVRSEFEYLSDVFQSVKETYPNWADFETLSMGMSGDYKLAIASGSNMVRIGSLLFGER